MSKNLDTIKPLNYDKDKEYPKVEWEHYDCKVLDIYKKENTVPYINDALKFFDMIFIYCMRANFKGIPTDRDLKLISMNPKYRFELEGEPYSPSPIFFSELNRMIRNTYLGSHLGWLISDFSNDHDKAWSNSGDKYNENSGIISKDEQQKVTDNYIEMITVYDCYKKLSVSKASLYDSSVKLMKTVEKEIDNLAIRVDNGDDYRISVDIKTISSSLKEVVHLVEYIKRSFIDDTLLTKGIDNKVNNMKLKLQLEAKHTK